MCAVVLGSVIHSEYRMDKIEKKIDRLDDIIQVDDSMNYTQNDVDCLARNIYYEAGVESKQGKYAVANVTVNRVKSGHWGNNVCKVVYAPKQFSWTGQRVPKPNKQLWAESKAVALDVLQNGARIKGLKHSLYYHATYIKRPVWADPQQHAVTIGQHKFYNQAKNSTVYI